MSELTRRAFCGSALAGAAGAGLPLAWVTGCGGRGKVSGEAGWNILFITADDLGWKDLACYGNDSIHTPALDRLADEGARFTNAFVVASSCAPSRASLITGQYPHTHGVNALPWIRKRAMLSPFRTTLPELLRKAGSRTAIQGKWHPSPYLPTQWYGYCERLSGMRPKTWGIDSAEKALAFIERHRQRSWFLEINFMQNHRDVFGQFHWDPAFPVDPADVHVPDYWALPDWPEIREEVAKFYSQTMKMDRIIGDLLRGLDEKGLTGNTIVVFISDNGPPFPGCKMTCYDRGTAVPLLMRMPGHIAPGSLMRNLTSSIDIMPTLLEALGMPVPDDIEGKSFLAGLTGAGSTGHRSAVFMEMTHHVHYLPTRAVRTRRWKYIRNYSDSARGLDQCNRFAWAHRLCRLPQQPWTKPRVPEELYDVARDLDERENLANDAEHRATLERMRSLLDDHMRGTDDPYLGAPFTHDYDPSLYEPPEAGEKDW